MKSTITEYDEIFLRLSWAWLNDPELKRLTNTPDFSEEEQKRWFETLGIKNDYVIWGIIYEGVRIGAFGIKKIANGTGEYWGYIGEKKYWGKGIGKEILHEAIKRAKNLGIHTLRLRVMKDNKRAIALYRNSDFIVTHEDINEQIMEVKFNAQLFGFKK